MDYKKVVENLDIFQDRPLMTQASKAIKELLELCKLYEEKIQALENKLLAYGMSDWEKLQDIKEGTRIAYYKNSNKEHNTNE